MHQRLDWKKKRRYIIDFINLYRNLPCLWNVRNSDYNNKTKKAEAYGQLILLMNTVKPNANNKAVARKISYLRNTYRREKNKVRANRNAPTVWFYDLMTFLDNKGDNSEYSYYECDEQDNKYVMVSPSKIEVEVRKKKFIMDFINLYRSLPCLWNVKCKEYSNRKKKCEAYQYLITLMKKVNPYANRETAVKKIDSLRNVYRKERNKLLAGIKEAPTLWFYHLMMFLDSNEEIEEQLSVEEEHRDEEQIETFVVEEPMDITIINVDLKEFKEQFLKDFIALYKSLPCLWNKKCKEYNSKKLKREGYQHLVALMKTIDPNANRESAVKKINCLRTSYRKERSKIKSKTKKKGVTLWYYNLMTFLNDEEHYLCEERQCKECKDHDKFSDDDPMMSHYIHFKPKAGDSATPQQANNYSFYGKYVALELDKLPQEMATVCKKLIISIIFEAQMDNLNIESRIISDQILSESHQMQI